MNQYWINHKKYVPVEQLTSKLCAHMHRFRGWAFPNVCKRCYSDRVRFIGEQWANGSQLTIVHSQRWPRGHGLLSIQRVVHVVALYSVHDHNICVRIKEPCVQKSENYVHF